MGTFGHPREGMNTEAVREAVSVMSSVPVGDQRGSVVVGPVDVLTLEGVADIFLKTLEDRHPKNPRAFLWAWDEGLVRPTIRSRCRSEWCPGQTFYDREIVELVKAAVEAAGSRSRVPLLEAFVPIRERWKDDGEEFLAVTAQVLATREAKVWRRLWLSLRPVFQMHDPTVDEVLAGFLL